MTNATPAPITPTSSDMRAPKQTRLSRSRPCTSVPNQCLAPGGWNCASVIASEEYGDTSGQISTSTSSTARNQRLITAGVFRRKRRQARSPGLSTLSFWLSTFCSLIPHSPVQKRQREISEQVQQKQKSRVEQHKPHQQRVIL